MSFLDSAPRQPSPAKRDEEEMRFTGIRRPDNPIPSRAFHALQKMTQGADENSNQQQGINTFLFFKVIYHCIIIIIIVVCSLF